MSDVKNEVNKQTDSLAPIQDKDRIMGWGSYLMLWLGGCISIGTLTMGSAQLDKGLNLMQVFLAVLIGSTILVIGICANDRFSYKSGAPYAVQLKSAYGTKGNIVPVMIRGLPAIVWYGFQTWLGGSAINQISIAIFGYDNVVLFFLLFQVVQIILSVKGFHGIKWVENIGGVVIVSAMLYMLFVCVTQYWGVIGDKLISRKGSWGMPFIAAIIAFFGNSTTVMLNAGDYSRELKGGFFRRKARCCLFYRHGTNHCPSGTYRRNGFHGNRDCKPHQRIFTDGTQQGSAGGNPWIHPFCPDDHQPGQQRGASCLCVYGRI